MSTPKSAGTLLLIDDEDSLRADLSQSLGRYRYVVETAESVTVGERIIERGGVQLVLLDITMPERDGWSILPDLVKLWDLPVIVMTANADLNTRVRAFKEGAIDYIAKPFFIEELVARIRTRLHHETYATVRTELRFGGCLIDLAGRTVHVDGAPVPMTEAEFDILAYFAARPGRAISRAMLAENALTAQSERAERTIDSHVSRIRAKLGVAGGHIRTAWGIGWKLDSGSS
ncbi:MAG: response regulator transcription factor [Sphingomonas sp.]|uniref:response regulator transcription factor n=1 Tax=Sphingomonas sp. TaxID=28214 RepID=UPI000DB61DA2|nr:DNA-binding response regulator [Zymomonas sp.]MBA4772576.1 response regulator transcription factor [Sphingomonas sp.]PZP19168.1 MAG: DNA-binding response regulator [Sphingomonas hengshuiensis]